MPFRCRIPVRFGDVDYAKIVYYPRILHYCHVAMEEAFAGVVGTPYHVLITQEKVGYPAVKLTAEYLKPVGFGETLEMSVFVERLGGSSIDFRYEGRRSSDGELAFRVRNTVVAVDMDRWQSLPIPDAHRRGLATILEPRSEP